MPALASRRFATSIPRAHRHSIVALLLKRYLTGQIADAQWRQIEAGLEAVEADPSEREAYAAFCLDAVANGEEIKHPAANEAGDLLESIR